MSERGTLAPEEQLVLGFVKSRYYRTLREALVLKREAVMEQTVTDLFMAGVKEGTLRTLTEMIRSPELVLAFWRERRKQEAAAEARGEKLKDVDMPPLPALAERIVRMRGDDDLIQ